MSFVKQVGGNHYGGTKFQHWDFVLQTGQDYISAVATKYLTRWRDKGGIQDVQKAISYVDKMLDALAHGEMSWPLPIDHAKARLLWPLYLETYKLPNLEHDATYNLVFALNVHDVLCARSIMQRIMAKEVFSWPELSPVMSKMKPDGWQGFTFEGTKQNFCWHRCTSCRVQFQVPMDMPPMLYHECGSVLVNVDPAPGNDKTAEYRFPSGWHGLGHENGYRDDDGKPTGAYVNQGGEKSESDKAFDNPHHGHPPEEGI